MTHSASRVGGGEAQQAAPVQNPVSYKTYAFATAIIFSVGGSIVGFVGLAGYCHVGALSSLSQVNAIIMMASGWGTVLIIGIVGTVMHCYEKAHERVRFTDDIDSGNEIGQNDEEVTGETRGPSVYGAAAWGCWNIKAVGEVPEMPNINWDEEHPLIPGKNLKETCLLVYFPPEVQANGKKQRLILNLFKDHPLVEFLAMSESSRKLLFDTPITPGWKLVTMELITNSRNKNFSVQQTLFNGTGYRLPKAEEMVISILMHHAYTKEKIFGGSPLTLTRCDGLLASGATFIVGEFGYDDIWETKTLLVNTWLAESAHEMLGVAAIRDL